MEISIKRRGDQHLVYLVHFFFHTYSKISDLHYFLEGKPMDENSIIFSEAVRHCLLGSLSWYLHNT